MANPVVWFEVMGKDGNNLRTFYGELFGWKFDVDENMNYGMVEANGAKASRGAWAAGINSASRFTCRRRRSTPPSERSRHAAARFSCRAPSFRAASSSECLLTRKGMRSGWSKRLPEDGRSGYGRRGFPVRRADRLFQIIQLLRGRRRAVTARWLAEQLEVSERTVYRDIRDLIATGTPIEGAAGVGYSLRSGYDLPPLLFNPDEIEALVLGARIVASFGDQKLARAAADVMSKVEAVLPAKLKPKLANAALYAPSTSASKATSEGLLAVRAALTARQKLRIHYVKEDGAASDRLVWPLGAFFWGRSWTITAWCELRNDFRNFRLDRIESIEPTAETFPDDPNRSLRTYLLSIGVEADG